MEEDQAIALFDLDGTLCDYDKVMSDSLKKLRSREEPKFHLHAKGQKIPPHIQARMDLIRSSEEWWLNMPKFKLGWDVLKIAKRLGFRIVILTKGPRRNPAAYSGKKKWIDKNMGNDTEIILTRDKGLVYGRVLVDDFPPYIEAWLKYRPRGIVIMPANESNKNFVHPQVIRYDGKNIRQVRLAMKVALTRLTR